MKKKKIEDIEIVLQLRKGVPKGAENVLRNHIKIFYLEKIYQLHKDIIEELYLKTYYYNDSRKKEQLEMKVPGTNQDLFTASTLQRFILGNYSLNSELNNRPLAKMTKYVAQKVDLLNI